VLQRVLAIEQHFEPNHSIVQEFTVEADKEPHETTHWKTVVVK